MRYLTNKKEIDDARLCLSELLNARAEWFCSELAQGRSVELRRGDWDLYVARGALLFSFWGETGVRTLRIRGWTLDGEKLLLEPSPGNHSAPARIELVPRAAVAMAKRVVADARLAEAVRIANLLCESFNRARKLRVSLSPGATRGDPGRYARIVLRIDGDLVYATGPVTPFGTENVDGFLASALSWFLRSESNQNRPAVRRLIVMAPSKLTKALSERVPLLRKPLKKAIEIVEIDEEGQKSSTIHVPMLDELLDAPVPRAPRRERTRLYDVTSVVISLDPDAIDAVRSRSGETLRYRGLPFARVREVLGEQHLWFGALSIAGRRLLDDSNWIELLRLVEELAEHRRADASDKNHAFYKAAPEAWLESILRRDVSKLDPGLRLAPLHSQFRIAKSTTANTGSRPVDLLALRHDGRLAVIELKVSEDSALALQTADYWRRIAAQHRAGNIARARLFDDAYICDDPPLAYIVAPMLRFHRSFEMIAHAIAPEIQMYRFDLNEDWRHGVRVTRRYWLT